MKMVGEMLVYYYLHEKLNLMKTIYNIVVINNLEDIELEKLVVQR